MRGSRGGGGRKSVPPWNMLDPSETLENYRFLRNKPLEFCKNKLRKMSKLFYVRWTWNPLIKIPGSMHVESTVMKFQKSMQKSSATTKQKRSGRTSRDSVDNFFVQHDKVVLVNQFKGKVEKMFEIQLVFEDPVDGGQWLNLQGDQGDRRNAKVKAASFTRGQKKQPVLRVT